MPRRLPQRVVARRPSVAEWSREGSMESVFKALLVPHALHAHAAVLALLASGFVFCTWLICAPVISLGFFPLEQKD